MALFTTALDLYGGVLWSGELQGFIIHERVPTYTAQLPYLPCWVWSLERGAKGAPMCSR
jgi:hypothetical protein